MALEAVSKEAQTRFIERLQECASTRNIVIDTTLWHVPTHASLTHLTVWSRGKAYKFSLYSKDLTNPAGAHKREERIKLILDTIA